MKKLFGKIAAIFTAIAVLAMVVIITAKVAIARTKATLSCKRGEGFVDTAVKILMAVVIGALVLAGLYLLFSATILPTLTQRINDMFNYGG